MRYYRKHYDVVGYTADADTWCIRCTERLYFPSILLELGCKDREGHEITPIFAGSECGYRPFCSACHCGLDVVVIDEQTGEKWD